MRLSNETFKDLLKLQEDYGILLEGPILNAIKTEDTKFLEYIRSAKITNKAEVRKRFNLSQELQAEQKKTKLALQQAQKANLEAVEAREVAENAREQVKKELDVKVKELEIATQKTKAESIIKVIDWLLFAIVATLTSAVVLYLCNLALAYYTMPLQQGYNSAAEIIDIYTYNEAGELIRQRAGEIKVSPIIENLVTILLSTALAQSFAIIGTLFGLRQQNKQNG